MNLQNHLNRARSGIGKGVRYKLGRGGFDVKHANDVAWDQKRCDCSGFVSWVLQTRRAPKPGRPFWIETTAVFKDATRTRQVFAQIADPVPGCLVVFPDRERPHHEGHIGVVSAVRSKTDYDVVDCTSKGITEHSGAYFVKRHAIFCVLKQDLPK